MTTIDLLPTEYHPTSIDEFYGPARSVARKIAKSAELCLPRRAPAAHLFVGPSGSGKTALANFTLDCYKVVKWNRTEYIGKDITVDAAREISRSMRLTSIYPGFRGLFLDEIDACTKEARERLLEFIGEAKQPRNSVIVATSNMPVDEFDALEKVSDARGRFTSRFQVWHVPGPSADDMVPLVSKWLPEERARLACNTAGTDSMGKMSVINVRALMKDITSLMVEDM